MAAKLLHSLTEENPDLQKQIGCMTGIFQLFDRQHIITRRRISGHSPKRLPSGSSHFNHGTFETESNHTYHRPTAKEKNSNKNANERHRVSMESSRASFTSSSRSSSFSSLDCNRTTQPETPSRDPTMSQSSASPQFGGQSLDLRDVVKDSMYREARGLSVKTTTKEEQIDCVVNRKDSPRPLQLSKSKSVGGKQDLPVDLKESLRVLAKRREAPWYFNEAGERSRSSCESKDGYLFSAPKDAPRFSYDGRELNRPSFESRDSFKSAQKLKELPRLSLDSRDGSVRSFNSDSKSDFLLKNSQRDDGNSSQPPGVVAKLMGLEALPNAALSSENQIRMIKTSPGEKFDSFSKSTDPCRRIRISSSSRSSWKEPASPRWKNPDSVMKPMSSSRVPIEPAPWKHLEASRGSQKPALRHLKAPARANDLFPSVYCEIEKRLKNLEFTQSGKDLRALKQILEAMQANQRKPQSDRLGDFTNKGATSFKTYDSQIVIMKPAKLVEKSGIHASSVIPMDKLRGVDFADGRKSSANSQTSKEQITKASENKKYNSRTLKSTPSSTRSQQLLKETTTSPYKSLGSTSPRLQLKKLELEKRSRPPIPPDSGKSRRQANKQQAEFGSPGGKRRTKSANLQQSEDQSSEIISETRNLSYQEDETSMQSDGNIEVTSGSQSPSMKAAKFSVYGLVQTKLASRLSEEGELAELALVTPEHPSPVSVLDDTMYRDDSPSPVKQISDALKDDGSMNSNDNYSRDQWDSAENLSMETGLKSEINRKKLENIEHLVQKLRRLNSTHDEARTDYIASLCESTTPDHRYISEILLASGLLLRDLNSSQTSFQLHSSGHPINPELFLVLEQTKSSKEESNIEKIIPVKEKFHRKLIFDAVNELLIGKLGLLGACSEPWLRPCKLVRKSLNAQKLLGELCSEIEQIQAKKPAGELEEGGDGLKSILWEDVMCRSENWTDLEGEVSGMVLDVERLIFKDLVGEIVHGEAAQPKPGRRCLRLFA